MSHLTLTPVAEEVLKIVVEEVSKYVERSGKEPPPTLWVFTRKVEQGDTPGYGVHFKVFDIDLDREVRDSIESASKTLREGAKRFKGDATCMLLPVRGFSTYNEDEMREFLSRYENEDGEIGEQGLSKLKDGILAIVETPLERWAAFKEIILLGEDGSVELEQLRPWDVLPVDRLSVLGIKDFPRIFDDSSLPPLSSMLSQNQET